MVILRCLFCPDDFKIQITKFKTVFCIKFTVFLELGIEVQSFFVAFVV